MMYMNEDCLPLLRHAGRFHDQLGAKAQRRQDLLVQLHNVLNVVRSF